MKYNYQWYEFVTIGEIRKCCKCNKIIPWNLVLCTWSNCYCYSCYSGKIDFTIMDHFPFLLLDVSGVNRFHIENRGIPYDVIIDKSNVNDDDYILIKELYHEFIIKKPLLSPKYYDIGFDFYD